MKPLAIITGVGPGTGTALAHRFHAGGYRVALVARDRQRLEAIARDLPGAIPIDCDITDTSRFIAALESAVAEAGAPKAIVHNAVGGAFGDFLEIDPAILERNFQVNVVALLHLARWAAPKMKHGGSIVVTGNTSAERGRAHFAGFAPTKAAQRILTESIARSLGPRGIHVAYLVIDAVIDVAWTRAKYPDRPDDFFIAPGDIAGEVWHLAHQPRSAWTFRSEGRPFGESW